ncbi:MAG TPA: cob(I)yrinic acid a,c-diamide adenosyltransferase [Firmicutes bacterium]|nr:cob(I)yrinic acid a,c-diamide adenosyltransferase [Bacillota bacterium]
MREKQRGIIQIYTGDGKGKTTAAVGQAVRAAGSGLKVVFFQFFKSGVLKSGEEEILKNIKNIDYVKFDQKSPFFDKGFDLDSLKKRVARDMGTAERALCSGEYDMAVLDEAVYAAAYNLFMEKDFIEILKKRKGKTEVIITGRNASEEICAAADLVTEMREIKHPFKKGIKMKKGREY